MQPASLHPDVDGTAGGVVMTSKQSGSVLQWATSYA